MINIGAIVVLLTLHTSCINKEVPSSPSEQESQEIKTKPAALKIDSSEGIKSFQNDELAYEIPEPINDAINLPTQVNSAPAKDYKVRDEIEIDDVKGDVNELDLRPETENPANEGPKLSIPGEDTKSISGDEATESDNEERVVSDQAEMTDLDLPSAVAPHDAWHQLLQKYVSNEGVVNYTAFKANEANLDKYLQKLNDIAPSEKDRSNKAKAFWINAYNAFTIKLIVSNFPISSITDIDNGRPWDTKWIKLGSKTYSLNNIEHDILRPVWKDARIHFAVNCAAKSCPPISNKAFTEGNTDKLLTTLTKKFINNTNYNKISSSSLELSKIFEWYKDDFGNLPNFITKYTTVGIDAKADVAYKDYNWALNGK